MKYSIPIIIITLLLITTSISAQENILKTERCTWDNAKREIQSCTEINGPKRIVFDLENRQIILDEQSYTISYHKEHPETGTYYYTLESDPSIVASITYYSKLNQVKFQIVQGEIFQIDTYTIAPK